MYGVPDDLPLDQFVGKEIHSIVIGQFYIHFSIGKGSIAGQGTWELRDSSGQVVDLEQNHATRDCYRIHRILAVPITSFAINPPYSFTLVFESGYSLEILDDDEHYESFVVQLEGMSAFII